MSFSTINCLAAVLQCHIFIFFFLTVSSCAHFTLLLNQYVFTVGLTPHLIHSPNKHQIFPPFSYICVLALHSPTVFSIYPKWRRKSACKKLCGYLVPQPWPLPSIWHPQLTWSCYLSALNRIANTLLIFAVCPEAVVQSKKSLHLT